MILNFLSWCPGVLGLILRQKFYPLYLKGCGKSPLFGRFVKLKGVKNITIGDNVVINDWAVIDAGQRFGDENSIRIEDNVFVGAGTEITTFSEDIIIGEKANIGSECRIVSDRKTILEPNVLLAAYCRIGNDENQMTGKEGRLDRSSDDVETRIGQGCWFGVRTILRSGVKIGHGTIVGAHALVENNLPANIVAVGKPAERLYSRM